MKRLRQVDWVFVGAIIFALFALISLVCGCDQILDSDDGQEVVLRIHITGFGGSSSGSRWQRGYVKNHSGPKVVRVKVLWSSDQQSGTANCSPNVLDKGDQGSYYFSYVGNIGESTIDYDKE